MKKSLIALAVASVFIAPVALAQTVMYGLVSGSLEMVDSGAATNNKTTQIASNSSRIGFKGSEKLDTAGLSAFWQVESDIRMDDPATANKAKDNAATPAEGNIGTVLGNRDSFVGLKSDSLGSLILGSGGTPYRGATRGLDLFRENVSGRNYDRMGNRVTAAEITAGIAGTASRLDGGGTNVLAYVSPTMGGVNVTVAKGFDEDATKSADASFITVKYNAGPIYATVAQGTFNHSATSDTTGTKVGGGYTTDAFTVNAVLENIAYTNGASETTYRNMYLGGKFNISKTDSVMLGITTAGDTELNGVSSPNGYRHTTVGYYHNMSKATTVYALITKTALNTTGNEPTTIAFGTHTAF